MPGEVLVDPPINADILRARGFLTIVPDNYNASKPEAEEPSGAPEPKGPETTPGSGPPAASEPVSPEESAGSTDDGSAAPPVPPEPPAGDDVPPAPTEALPATINLEAEAAKVETEPEAPSTPQGGSEA